MILMLDKKHKMQVNKKHAKQGAEIPGYNKYLKKSKKKKLAHSNYAYCPNKNVRFFLNQKLKHAKLKFNQKNYLTTFLRTL